MRLVIVALERPSPSPGLPGLYGKSDRVLCNAEVLVPKGFQQHRNIGERCMTDATLVSSK